MKKIRNKLKKLNKVLLIFCCSFLINFLLFIVHVYAENVAPSFTLVEDELTVSEDSGEHVIENWASNISNGGEDGQSVGFNITNVSSDLFSSGPVISPDGTLTFTPKENIFGSAEITVVLSDNGGTESGGQDTSEPETFTITVESVNDAPVNTELPSYTGAMKVGESLIADAGEWNDNLDTSVSGTSSISYTYQWQSATDSDGTGLADIDGATGSQFEITAAQAHKYIRLKVTAKDTGVGEPDVQSTVAYSSWKHVENTKTVVNNDSLTTDEDTANSGQLTGSDVDGDNLTFTKVEDLYPLHGTVVVNADGSYTYTPDADYNGTDSFNFIANDGAEDSLNVGTVSITVNSLNDAPSFTMGNEISINEDSGKQTVSNWANSISVGPANESNQKPTFEVITDNDSLFSTKPSISSEGTLTYTLEPNAFGTAEVTVVLKDDGGVDNASEAQKFTITVDEVNDAPSFTKGSNVTVNEDSGQFSYLWATAISKGNLQEFAQEITFDVSTNNDSLFSELPSISPEGELTFTPADDANGVATVTVTLKDKSGTDNGGEDTSETQSFVITINPDNDDPTMSGIADQSMGEDEASKTVSFTVNDIDNENSLLTIKAESDNETLIPISNLVIAGTGSNRTISFAPAENQYGTAKITVTVSDGEKEVSDDFEVTVSSINDLPEISGIANQTIDEDKSTGNIEFTVIDVETLSSDLDVSFTSTNSTLFPEGAITLGGTDEKRYINLKPAENLSGSTTITVTVTDEKSEISRTSFIVTVKAVNDLPTLNVPNNQVIDEGSSTDTLNISFSDNETLDAKDYKKFIVTSRNTELIPESGIEISGEGLERTIKITPKENAVGIVPIEVSVTDGSGGVTTKLFTVEIKEIIDAPTIVNNAVITIDEDETSKVYHFSVSDIDNKSDALVVTATSDNPGLISSEEGIILGGSGSDRTIKFIPTHNMFGEANITINVSDGKYTDTTRVKVQVNNVNDAPYMGLIANQHISINSFIAEIPVWINDIDDEADTLKLTAEYDTDLISKVEFAGSGNNRTVKVTSKDVTGDATIRVNVTDNGGLTRWREFTVHISAGGYEEPIISYILDQSTNEDTQSGYIYFSVKQEYGDDVTITSGDIGIIPNDANNIILEKMESKEGYTRQQWRVRFTPASNANGNVTLTVTAKIVEGTTATREFNLNVIPVDDKPIIEGNDFITVDEDNSIPENIITLRDIDSDSLKVSVISSDESLFPSSDNIVVTPSSENINVTEDGVNMTIKLTPAANKNGSTVITVWASDESHTVHKSFYVTVNAVNDIPTITAIDNQSVDEDTVSEPINFTVDDAELASGDVIVSATSSNTDLITENGIILGGSGKDRTITLIPSKDVYTKAGETVTITVNITDGEKTESGEEVKVSETFEVTINPVNDVPKIGYIANQTIDEDTSVGPIKFKISDIDSDLNDEHVEVIATSSNESLIPSNSIVLGGSGENRTIILTPSADKNGSSVITIKVTDAEGGSTTRTFDFNVTPVNDAPTIVIPEQVTIDEDHIAEGINITIGDLETDVNALTYEIISGNQTILPDDNIDITKVDGNITLKLTPEENQNGVVNITIRVNDGDIITTKFFKLNVTPVNDAPTISEIANQTIKEDQATNKLSFTVEDIEKSAGSLEVTAISSNTDLIPNSKVIIGGTGSNRTIKLVPLKDQFGDTTIRVFVTDGDITTEETFVVHVNPVDDVPSFIKGGNQTVLEDSGAQTVNGWATELVKGPSNESNQTLDFIVSVDDSSLFSITPSILADGTLSYTPADDAYGVATVTVKIHDNGTTANGGVDTSAEQTFTITITPVNDVPVFEKGANQTVFEDAPAQTISGWATGISKGAENESSQELNFIVTTNNDDLFDTLPGIDSITGDLSYTLKANANGVATVTVKLHDDGGIENGGVDTSAEQTFTITVEAVNDVPYFTPGENQVVNEDTRAHSVNWATNISTGAENEEQTLTFTVTNDNNGLFSVQPVIDASGNLTYTLKPDENGVANVTIRLGDDGGIENSGVDTSVDKTFTITVNPVNDAPTFDMSTATQTWEEDDSNGYSHSYDNFVTNKAVRAVGNPSNESAASNELEQSLGNLVVTNNNNSIFSAQPAIDADGKLTYSLKPDACGSATVTVTLKDDGGTLYGGVDSTSKTFVIDVTPINDVPSFTKGADITIAEDSSPQSISNWATDISVGALFENQTLTFTVTNDNNELFSVQPAIDATGKLTYTLAENANGEATITVVLSDNGGTANGGANTSAEQSFTITVTAVKDAPVNTVLPVVTGNLDIESSLSTTEGTWNDDKDINWPHDTYSFNPIFTYQWQIANDSSGNNTQDILGATSSTYTLTENEKHKYVRVAVTATDGGYGDNGEQSAIAYSTWQLVNDRLPVITQGDSTTITMDEDSNPQAFELTLDTTDADLDTITWSISSQAGHGTATVAGTGTSKNISYVPDVNFNGEDSFVVKIDDGYGGTDFITVNVTVNPINDAPVNTAAPVVSGTRNIPDTLSTTTGTWNDIIDTTWQLDYTPNFNYSYQWQRADDASGSNAVNVGTDANSYTLTEADTHKFIRVIVTATDNGYPDLTTSSASKASAWVAVNNREPIIDQGNEPIAMADMEEDSGTNTIQLSATDADLDTITWSISGDASHGIVNVDETTGLVSYTPSLDYNGTDSFVVKVDDSKSGYNGTDVITVTVNIGEVNDVPTADNGTLTTNEDAAQSDKLEGSDVDGDDLTYSKVTDPSHGTVVINADGNYTYTPDANYNGIDSFTFKVYDGELYSNEATITITVNALNDAPVNTELPSYTGTMKVGQSLTGDKGNWNDDIDTNVSGTSLISYEYQWQVATDNSGVGLANIEGASSTSYEITSAEAHKYIRLKVTGTDSGVGTPSTQSTIAYSAWKLVEDTEPTADNGTLTTDEDTANSGQLAGSDVDGDNLTYSKVTDPSHGSVTVNSNGSYTYTPDANYNGEDSFTFKVNDGALYSDEATITITVNAVNDVPVNTVVPSYTGTMKVGQSLAGDMGNWNDDIDTNVSGTSLISYEYQWQVATDNSGVGLANIEGASSTSYEITSAEAHKYIRLKVTGTDSGVGTPSTQSTIAYSAWKLVEDTEPTADNGTLTTDEDTANSGQLAGSDVDGDNLTYSKVTDPSHGSVVVNTDGSYTYTPDANYNGIDSFTLKVYDGELYSSEVTITITVNALNDAPVNTELPSYTGTMKVGQSLTGDNGNWNDDTDTNVSGTSLISYEYQWQSATASDGTDSANIEGATISSFEITSAEAHKYIRLKVTATDDGVGTPDTQSTIAYSAWKLVEDTAPIANNGTLTTDEDTAKSGQLAGSDIDGDSLTYSKVTDPSHGTVTVNLNGSYTYTPDANYNGEDSFTFKVNDGTLDSSVATVTIIINAVNDDPTANNGLLTTDEDTAKSGQLSGNDIDGDNLTYSKVANPSHGSVNINLDGSYTYTPDVNYNGEDSFTFKVNDGVLDSNVETVTITVNAVNDAPVNTVVPSYTGTMKVGQSLAGDMGNWNDNIDTDVSGTSLISYEYQWQSATASNGDGLADIEGASSTSYEITSTEAHKYIRLKVTGTDSGVGTPSTQSTIAYSAWKLVEDTAPTADNGTLTTDEDTAKSGQLAGSDIDGDNLTYSKVTDPSHGTVVVNADGSYTYTPIGDYNGVDSFTFKANDGVLDSNVATVTIIVNAVNDEPVANNGSLTTDEDTAKSGQLSGNDIDGDSLTYSKVTDPSNGTVVVNEDGSYTYTPTGDYNGVDSFTFKVNDGALDSNVATVTITVNAVNDKPKANDGLLTTDEDTAKSGQLAGSDIDGDNLTYSKVTDPSHGTVVVNVDGSYTYIPNEDYNGTDYFTFKVNDGALHSNVATVNINVIHHESNAFITLTSNPTSIVGDGVQTATLTTHIFASNNRPVSGVEVKFSAVSGDFPNGNTGITDENGLCSIAYRAPKIQGLESEISVVKAKVIDSSKNLYAYSELLVTFEPSSIQGVVIDNNLQLPIEGATVEVSKDFDEDGIVDFYAKMITAADGKYKIAVPKGNVNYDVFITKPVKIGNEIKEVTFNQSCPIGEITGAGSDTFDADNAIGGLVLLKTPDESTKALEEYDKYTVKINDAEGNTKFTTSLNDKSLYQADGLETGKTYDLAVTYSLGNGEEIVVGESEVTVTSNGEINISTILIDPYGVITDADTGEVIEDAKVVLYYANTQRNVDSRKIPDTEVDLPILKGFEPSDNANPQYSNYLGQYAFMVFPNTDYYIVSVKSGYETFTSETISVYDEIVQYNFEMKKETIETEVDEIIDEDEAVTESEDKEIIQEEKVNEDKVTVKEETNISKKVLPKTGVLFDNALMIFIGILFVMLGVLLCIFSKKIRKN